ncbi:hypothetical protein FJT64_008006 [Amphibalanus amphitrite]|uniref:Apple domain-containing protein n=1 Tax=Amphibalanus amphitrite TaxID=1232801 RepID=A0A6A4VD64_AMPAM|nr:uncharacterized protein LOC122388975 [Amphibalanus amphitrite]KAF0294307.1 hypothetical protein FJT64_008006 [Amphibalanus amphitrite]
MKTTLEFALVVMGILTVITDGAAVGHSQFIVTGGGHLDGPFGVVARRGTPDSPHCFEDRFVLKRTGFRMRSSYVDKTLLVSSVSDCERACTDSLDFICEAFSFSYGHSASRLASSSASADNCELSGGHPRRPDSPDVYKLDRDYDYYERVRVEDCM